MLLKLVKCQNIHNFVMKMNLALCLSFVGIGCHKNVPLSHKKVNIRMYLFTFFGMSNISSNLLLHLQEELQGRAQKIRAVPPYILKWRGPFYRPFNVFEYFFSVPFQV